MARFVSSPERGPGSSIAAGSTVSPTTQPGTAPPRPSTQDLRREVDTEGVLGALAAAGGGGRVVEHAWKRWTAHSGNNYLPLLERYYRSHRSTLFPLLDALQLEATSADHRVLGAVGFLKAYRNRHGEFVPDHVGGEPLDLSFAADAWQKILRDRRRPTRLVRRHLVRCACSPTWRPSCAPATLPWSARTPTPTCTTSCWAGTSVNRWSPATAPRLGCLPTRPVSSTRCEPSSPRSPPASTPATRTTRTWSSTSPDNRC